MKKAYPHPSSSKPVRKISFSCLSDSLPGLICHCSPNGWKNLLLAFVALLFISSCKKVHVEQKVTSIVITPSSSRMAVGGKQLLEITVLLADAANKEIIKDETWGSALVTGMAKGMGAIMAISFVLFILKLCAQLCVQLCVRCVKKIYKSIRRKP